jgi:DNA-binding NarL/FixJ family response regulator
MDIGMPELNGIEAIIQIRRQIPNARIIALSMHSEHDFIWKAFKAGAYAYLLKDCAAAELVNAIRQVNSGKKYISEDISDVIIQDFIEHKGQDPGDFYVPLSDREKEVLQLLVEGKSTRSVAEILFISNKTVESHRKNIMEKLQIFSLPELTKYAIRSGLTSLD